ncbi:DUF3486 family protein [Faecalicatena sp. BF-R-105]|nr:DUF3486 family protein [Faecalicatena sp. BF-R-105]
MEKKRRKPRSDSKIFQLPPDVREQLDHALIDSNMSYRDIQAWLEEKHNIKVNLSSISSYAFRIYEAADRVAQDLEKTKFIVDYIGKNSDVDTVQVTSAILKSGLLQRLSTAEEEFNELPIDQASRLFLQIAKTESSVKRNEFEMRKKIDIAFEGLEAKLLETVKADPGLSQRMKDLLIEAKELISRQDD